MSWAPLFGIAIGMMERVKISKTIVKEVLRTKESLLTADAKGALKANGMPDDGMCLEAFPAGTWIYGAIQGFTLTSGAVRAYKV